MVLIVLEALMESGIGLNAVEWEVACCVWCLVDFLGPFHHLTMSQFQGFYSASMLKTFARAAGPENLSKAIFPFAELILHARTPQWTVDIAAIFLLKMNVQSSCFMFADKFNNFCSPRGNAVCCSVHSWPCMVSQQSYCRPRLMSALSVEMLKLCVHLHDVAKWVIHFLNSDSAPLTAVLVSWALIWRVATLTWPRCMSKRKTDVFVNFVH